MNTKNVFRPICEFIIKIQVNATWVGNIHRSKMPPNSSIYYYTMKDNNEVLPNSIHNLKSQLI
jgi:hypothetical protein